MSRNRLSELQPPPNGDATQAYPQGQYDNVDLERNDDIAGERYELQDRSARQLTLNEFLDEVRISMCP
jgi:myo-inositol-hexaphosphate 3-phosphohydrolase